MPTYQTHDNGGRTYRVKITNGRGGMRHVEVSKIEDEDGRLRNLFELDSPEVFVGKSPLNAMTRFSGGHGRAFDGNSIVVALQHPNEYLHIGRSLITFRTGSPIMRYESPVGNNDVPYPWAVDEDGNYYLIIEGVVLLARPGLKERVEGTDQDPYSYYYKLGLMSPDRGTVPPRLPEGGNFRKIDHMTVGNEEYHVRYNPTSEDIDRVTRNGERMSLIYEDGRVENLTRRSYLKLMRDFAKARGFRPMDIVEERQA